MQIPIEHRQYTVWGHQIQKWIQRYSPTLIFEKVYSILYLMYQFVTQGYAARSSDSRMGAWPFNKQSDESVKGVIGKMENNWMDLHFIPFIKKTVQNSRKSVKQATRSIIASHIDKDEIKRKHLDDGQMRVFDSSFPRSRRASKWYKLCTDILGYVQQAWYSAVKISPSYKSGWLQSIQRQFLCSATNYSIEHEFPFRLLLFWGKALQQCRP